MVQPSQSSVRYDPTGGRTGNSGGWCLFREAEMRAVFVVVADVLIEQPFQMAFIECDDVVQEVAAAAPPSAPRCHSARGFRRKSERDRCSRSEQQPELPTRTWRRDRK